MNRASPCRVSSTLVVVSFVTLAAATCGKGLTTDAGHPPLGTAGRGGQSAGIGGTGGAGAETGGGTRADGSVARDAEAVAADDGSVSETFCRSLKPCDGECIPQTGCCTSDDCGPPLICDGTGSCSCPMITPDLCGSNCVTLRADPTNCGACGHDCTALPNLKPGAAVKCASAGTCLIPSQACATGFANCTTAERETDGCETAITSDVDNCGACGRACAVANGTPSCRNGTCEVGECDTNYHTCGSNTCYSTSDPAHCGPDCNVCPNAPAGASEICNRTTGACSFACNSGFACGDQCYSANVSVACGPATVCANWGFESGLEGWTLEPGSDRIARLSVDAAHYVDGKSSLAIEFNYPVDPIRIHVSLCQQGINLAGRAIRAQILVAADATGKNTVPPFYSSHAVYSTNDAGDAQASTPLVPRVWNAWSEVLPSATTVYQGIALQLSGVGIAYVDSVQITP